MTSRERWQQQRRSDQVYHVRLRVDVEDQVRRLAFEYSLPVSTVIADLVTDGLKVYRGEVRT